MKPTWMKNPRKKRWTILLKRKQNLFFWQQPNRDNYDQVCRFTSKFGASNRYHVDGGREEESEDKVKFKNYWSDRKCELTTPSHALGTEKEVVAIYLVAKWSQTPSFFASEWHIPALGIQLGWIVDSRTKANKCLLSIFVIKYQLRGYSDQSKLFLDHELVWLHFPFFMPLSLSLSIQGWSSFSISKFAPLSIKKKSGLFGYGSLLIEIDQATLALTAAGAQWQEVRGWVMTEAGNATHSTATSLAIVTIVFGRLRLYVHIRRNTRIASLSCDDANDVFSLLLCHLTWSQDPAASHKQASPALIKHWVSSSLSALSWQPCTGSSLVSHEAKVFACRQLLLFKKMISKSLALR